MSPEHDNNPQTSAIETGFTERKTDAPPSVTSQAGGAAAATAMAREPEAAEPAPETLELTPEATPAVETAGEASESSAAAATEAPATPAPEGAAEVQESSETMDQLLDQFSTPQAAAEGEIFDGRVLAVTEAGVVVDVGGKFEGLVPAQEFLDSGNAIEFGPGQTIEVERLHDERDGYVLLSYARAHRRRVWDRIEKSYREHTNIAGKIAERIKGGL